MSAGRPLQLYNTLTRQKEPFRPLDAANVRMYVCGPTVYDFAHIGNARPVIVFDVLYRLLRHLYGAKHVTYVRNITDIDDKINKRAFERWTRKRPLLDEMRELTEGTAAQYLADVRALGCLDPDHMPRATAYVCDGDKPMDMVRVIERLIDRGVAYAAEGHVLFSPKAMDALPGVPDYGKLSRRPLDEMIAGARVEVAPYKRDPMDFVLWKPSDRETEPGWESPWGFGRPGWHIECSAMSAALLGETFDIHAGGIDLIFPHHENEIAQSCCAFDTAKMASVWMHNGFLQVEGQKMSKSMGNFRTIREVLNDWPGEVVRLNMLKTHYRQPIDWTVRSLEESERELRVWAGQIMLAKAHQEFVPDSQRDLWAAPTTGIANAIADDLNLPLVLKELRSLAKQGYKNRNAMIDLLKSCEFLGLLRRQLIGSYQDDLAGIGFQGNLFDLYDDARRIRVAYLNGDTRRLEEISDHLRVKDIEFSIDAYGHLTFRTVKTSNSDIQERITARLAARADKNFAESDRIRDELLAMGIQLKDGKDADGNPVTTWEVKR